LEKDDKGLAGAGIGEERKDWTTHLWHRVKRAN
jgi:hypothetical protein